MIEVEQTEEAALVKQGATLKGQSLCAFITALTSNSALFSYAKYVPEQSLAELKATHPQFHNLFELFCHQQYEDYKAAPQDYPALSPQQLKKLKQLSILSMCHRKPEVAMNLLLARVELQPMECVKLLIEMTDLGVLNVRISEQKNKMK